VVDLMLAWDANDQIQPKLLELNFTSHQSACEYHDPGQFLKVM
jgi:hypothetical protein